MSRWAERVLLVGMGALLVQAVVVITDVVVRHANPLSNQPTKRSSPWR